MAVTVPALVAAIQSAYPHQGSKIFPQVATAVSSAFVQWSRVPSFVLLRGTSAGILGSGTVAGKVFLRSSSLVAPALVSRGLEASLAKDIGGAVENGISTTITATGQYQGISTSVGAGTDTTKVVLALSGPLNALLLAQLQALGVRGKLAPLLASGLSQGIATLLKTTQGVGVVSGVGSGLPGSGVSVSFLL